MIALASQVRSRGHEVIFICVPDAEKRATAAGLHFVPVGAEQFPLGSTNEVEKQFSSRQGEDALKFTFDLVGFITRTIIRPLDGILAAERPDGVVFDTYQPYLELSAIRLDLPYVHIANAVPFDVSGDAPLCFFDWENANTHEARERNLEGIQEFRKLLEPSLQAGKEYADEHRITIDWNDLTATRSKLAWMTQLPAAFDFGDAPEGAPLYHAGPFINAKSRLPIDFPWDRLTGAPLVYASMGTLQNGMEQVFHTIIDAARTMEELQFVVALGNKLEPSLFEPLPDNVLVVGYAPQLVLLQQASLCITHAGLNTVLESLANRVPLVALPVTNDQPGVAARIHAKGVGEFLTLPELSPDSLRALIQQVRGETKYRENAALIGNAIAQIDGLSLAGELIERSFSKAPNAAGLEAGSPVLSLHR